MTVCALVLCWWAGNLRAESPEEILNRVETFYRKLESLEASFLQEVYWRQGQRVQASGGRIWFCKPDRLRWEYRYPERLLIVSDGQKVYFYLEEDRQVLVYPVEKAFTSFIWQFFAGKLQLSRYFEVLSLKKEDHTYLLELLPREKQGQVSRVKIRIKWPSGEIQEIWSWDFLGNLTHLTFKNTRLNLKMEENLFTFKPPEGVEILREE